MDPGQKLVPYKPKRRPPVTDACNGSAPEPLQGALALRPDLAEEAAGYARASRADATRRAYEADWRIFRAWCGSHDVRSLPASPETASAFLTEQARTKAVATLRRYVATLGKGHKLAGHPSPFGDARVKAILEGIARKKGVAQKQRQAFTGAMARDSSIEIPDVTDLRDRAVLLCALFSAMRRSELCALDVRDLTWEPRGVLARIRRSKTDQKGAGRVAVIPQIDAAPALCPTRALRAWLDVAGITEGPVFRGFKRNLEPRANALRPDHVRIVVKRAADSLGLDPRDFGAHSTRIGYVTEGRRAGISWETLMEQTGHRKVETIKRYSRAVVDPFKNTRAAEVFAASFAEGVP